MARTVCLLVVLIGLLVPSHGLQAARPATQQPATKPPVALSADPEVVSGIQLVEAGEYNRAILTLDNAARRLAQDPARASDLSQAYLYLGIAYLGKGHEAAARARFREALACAKDLSLSPGQYPPKVIDLFEAARDDNARRAAESARSTAQPTSTPQPTPAAVAQPPAVGQPPAAAPTKKKGGSTKWLIAGGGVVAAGVAVAVVAGGGGGDKGGSPTTTQPPPTLPPAIKTENFEGAMPPWDPRRFNIKVEGDGVLEATLEWVMPGNKIAILTMQLFDGVGNAVATANRIGDTKATMAVPVTPRNYELSLFYDNDCPGCVTPFHIVVHHP